MSHWAGISMIKYSQWDPWEWATDQDQELFTEVIGWTVLNNEHIWESLLIQFVKEKKKKTYKLWNKLLILKYASGSKTFTTLQ